MASGTPPRYGARMGRKLDHTLAVLNGLVGDYLLARGNPLATEMAFYEAGQRLPLDRAAISATYPDATPRVAVFLHGVMCTEESWRFRDGSDYGRKLQADLGITPLYVRYNSGLAIADNGEALANLLELLVHEYPGPVEEIIPIGYSMGGLVVRSACHVATERAHGWLRRVQRAIYVGTPHLGAPGERVGRVVASLLQAIPDPYTRLVADVGALRSAGIKDLGDADLRHEDRAGAATRLSLRDARHPVPLLPTIRHFLIAGSLFMHPRVAALFGDSLVPVTSATARRMVDEGSLELPAEHVKVLDGRSHLDLAHDQTAYEEIKAWCES